MKIKTKLTLSVGLLFSMILLLTIVSAFYVFAIKKDTENILNANYNTLEYSRNMLLSLDNMTADGEKAVAEFERNLDRQSKNITEPGEKTVTSSLQTHFMQMRNSAKTESLKSLIRQDIFEIMQLNMKAIKHKSDLAKKTAETANLWIAISGTLCFLIAFNLLINLPDNIASPIKELTASISQIAKKNYSQRVHFTKHNEYGDLARSFNTMAEKLQEYSNGDLHKLSYEKKRLETLVNNMHDPIIGLDENGIVLFVNEEALKVMGLKASETIGKPAVSLALTNDLVRSLILDDMQDNAAQTHPVKIFADNKESYFEKEHIGITVIPTGEDQSKNIGDVIILRNITVFKELDFAKTNFIATVSHEMKTPIASIKASIQLMDNEATGSINNDQKQLLQGIREDSDRLLKITGELLDLSQLETGNINLKIEKSRPSDIIRYAVESVLLQAEQKRLKIVTDISDRLPEIKADSEKTTWVLINFLTNAIRYSSEDNQVTVAATVTGGQVVFNVRDKGLGIDSRYKSKVFDKYFQVPGSSKSGTGLGLAISKEFIEAQHGTVGVESELGIGSNFYFKLPIA